jgi:hypothetical protein
MTNQGRRLDAALGPLDPKARALLALKSWREGVTPDKGIYSNRTPDEVAEFRRLIGLAEAANELAHSIVLIRSFVLGLETRCEVIDIRRALGEQLRFVGGCVRRSTRYPITESGFRRREKELRAELLPVGELATIGIEHYDGWTEADFEGDAGEQRLSAEAQERALKEVDDSLIELVRAGTLTGEVNDAGTFVHAGSFDDWFGETTLIRSEAGYEYEVLPDNLAPIVASQQSSRDLIEQLITCAPGRDDLPLDLEGDRFPASEGSFYAEAERLDVIALRDGIQRHWRAVRAIEIEVAALAKREFSGEDPLHPDFRNVLDEARGALVALREKLLLYAGEIVMSEPDGKELREIRQRMLPRATRV